MLKKYIKKMKNELIAGAFILLTCFIILLVSNLVLFLISLVPEHSITTAIAFIFTMLLSFIIIPFTMILIIVGIIIFTKGLFKAVFKK